jgi:hypothetical protein
MILLPQITFISCHARYEWSIYKKSSSGIVNIRLKEWDLCAKSGIEMRIVGLKREEWDHVQIVGYSADSGIEVVHLPNRRWVSCKIINGLRNQPASF